jgi:methionine sulfoxide reductase heme-binding subunit
MSSKEKSIYMKKSRINFLRIAVHVAGWLPLLWTLVEFLTNSLSANPIQQVLHRFGRFAVYFLVASLSCTPIKNLTGWSEPVKRRRALGLYSFMYAALHFTIFFAVDYAFNIREVVRLISVQPFIILGAASLLILLALAVTSNKYMMKTLGKNWKKLHRLVYLVGLLAVLHFVLARKGNLFSLSGNILVPLILGLLVILGLIVRIPRVREWLAGLRLPRRA